jgi:type I restriction enzyme, S subunit
MESVLKHTELKIDKSNWKLVKFGDVVAEPKETCKDIESEGIEHVVGLEHIDTGDLHLRKSATTEESTTFSKKFRKGDVLFGRRRAYLKKAAQADFDGICSGDITVFRAKNSLLPELLPFIVNNDKFFDFAVKHSAGGLSPRVKFKDLANYEFLLPPKAEQARLAELLWAMDDVIEKEKRLLDKNLEFKEVRMIDLLNGYNLEKDKNKLPNGWSLIKLKDLGTVSTSSVDKKNNKDEKEINLLNYMDVYSSLDKKIDSRINFMRVTANNNQLIKNQISIGDVLFTPSSETADDIGHSAVVTEDLPDTLHSYHLVRLRFSVDLDLEFKRFLFNNPKILYYFSRRAKGVTRMILGLDDFNETELRIPPLSKQQEIAKELSSIINLIANIQLNISASQSLQKSLINQIF